jgi:hypothetical protein
VSPLPASACTDSGTPDVRDALPASRIGPSTSHTSSIPEPSLNVDLHGREVTQEDVVARSTYHPRSAQEIASIIVSGLATGTSVVRLSVENGKLLSLTLTARF